jgi:hypothetical protein
MEVTITVPGTRGRAWHQRAASKSEYPLNVVLSSGGLILVIHSKLAVQNFPQCNQDAPAPMVGKINKISPTKSAACKSPS